MKKLISMNPFTGEVNGEFSYLSKEDIKQRVYISRSSIRRWTSFSASERGSLFDRLAHVLREKQKVVSETITKEMGKPIRQARTEIERCVNICMYFAEQADELTREEWVQTSSKKSYILFQPLGVILGIMPWNYPFIQTFRFAIPTLLAGNVVMVKPASTVPLCGLALEDAFRQAGFPEGVFQTLLIDSSSALDLIQADAVDGVSLTGSFKAGSQVASVAGSRIKKVVLELGGSDPFIVLEDATLDEVAKIAVQTRFVNAGQSCVAAKRFLLIEKIAEPFVERFITEMNRLIVGDPMNEQTDLGPLHSPAAMEELSAQVEDAQKKGAQVIEGPPVPTKGAFFRPVAVKYASREMRVSKEETFGPIAPMFLIRNEQELLELANDTEFGLGATIWSRDIARAEQLAKEIHAGFVGINQIVRSDPRLPFGGTKLSGIGRELSYFGVREFTNIKTVVVKDS